MKKINYSRSIAAIISMIMIIFTLSSCSLIDDPSSPEEIAETERESDEETQPDPEGSREEESEGDQEDAGEKEMIEDESPDGKQDDEGTEAEGDFFINAILRSIDEDDNTITIEQLINEPNEKEAGPVIHLDQDYEVIRSILIKKQDSEEEYRKEITLHDIPLYSEVGIQIQDGKAALIIYQIFVDAGMQAEIEPVDPEEEFFVNAILKDIDGNIIEIEQLFNDPDETDVGSQVELSSGIKAYISVVIRDDDGENEYIKEVQPEDLPLGEEIGLIIDEDSKARVIIYPIMVDVR